MRTTTTLPALSRRSPSRAVRVSQVASLAALLLGLGLLLTACGASSSTGNPGISAATATAAPAQYAYLYSRIDYPLQLTVGSADNVTLTLSPQSSLLSVAPGSGSGVATVGKPIPLPTDLQDYRDIGAAAETTTDGAAPITWQLVTAPRQSLLSDATATSRQYRDSVTFQWHVQATAAGQNTVNVILHIYYVYLDGSEQQGNIEVTQSPVPMLARAATPTNTWLPAIKLPLAGLTGLAGVVAFFQFLYTAFKTISDVTEPVKDAAHAAQVVRGHLRERNGST